MIEVVVKIVQLPNGEGLPLPAYQTAGAAGMDLYAAEEVTIHSGAVRLVPCGFAIELPEGYEAQVRSRSGLALQTGIVQHHGVGTIDSDYRGEVMSMLRNTSDRSVTLKRGDRIAQLVMAPVARVTWKPETKLSDTARSSGALGSTGGHASLTRS